MITVAVAAAIVAASTSALDPEDAQCRIVTYAADGARTETPPSRPYSRPSAVSMRSASRDPGSSHVSVSSSSSSGGGESVVRGRLDGRAITKTYNDKGCTVVIDERPEQGAGK
jgi:hypothetical protein